MDKNPRTPKAPPPFIPVTGLELTERWSVSWQAIFDLARQGILTPCEPEPDALKRRIKDDFGMISSVYSEDERGEYFSLWLYHPADCNRFEETFPEILEAWQQKYNSLKATHPQEPTDEEWITTHQVCELLGKKPFQILELMQIGKLQAFNSHGRQILPTGSIPTEYNGLRRLEQSLKTEGGRQAFWRPRKGMQDTKHPTEPYELFDCHLPIDPGEAERTLAELDRFLFRKSAVDALQERREVPEAFSPPEPRDPPPSKPNCMKKKGDYWEISYNNSKITIKNSLGLHYLSIIILTPGQSVSCAQLVAPPPDGTPMDTGTVIENDLYATTSHRGAETTDWHAKGKYLKKLQDLQSERDDPETLAERRKQIENEMDDLYKYAKERPKAPPELKKAQSSVSKALKGVYKNLRHESMDELAEHLEKSVVPDGRYGYYYAGSIEWAIEK